MATLNNSQLDTQKDRYLTFQVETENYGIAISHVTEIIGMQAITAVPETPKYIKGVINLRGKVIPIMDVRIRFGVQSREYDERTCVIVVDYEGKAVGLIVDRVSEVEDIPPHDIESSAGLGNASKGQYVSGMGKADNQIKMILDVGKLLYDEVA